MTMKRVFVALALVLAVLAASTAAQQAPEEPAVDAPVFVADPPVASDFAPVAEPVAVAPPVDVLPPVIGGLSPQVLDILKYVATALLAFFGLIFVFAGYRIFKVGLFILGFISFFAIVWIVINEHAAVWRDGNLWWLCYVIPALAGILGGFMFLCIVKVGVFFVGFALGVAIAGIVLSTPLGTKVLTTYWIHVVIVAGAGLVLGVVALFLEKALIIIGTSAFGAYMIAVGFDMCFSKPRVLSAILENIFSGQNINLDWDKIASQPLPYALIAGMVVFCVAGIIVQFCYTGRNYDHRRGRTQKRDPYGYDESSQPLLP